MPRLFPLVIIIVLIFIGGTYFVAMNNQAQQTTTIANNSSTATGWHLLSLASGFGSDTISILAFVGVLILVVGAFAVFRSGGD